MVNDQSSCRARDSALGKAQAEVEQALLLTTGSPQKTDLRVDGEGDWVPEKGGVHSAAQVAGDVDVHRLPLAESCSNGAVQLLMCLVKVPDHYLRDRRISINMVRFLG